MKIVKFAAAAAAVLLGSTASAQAAVIITPASVKIDVGGEAGMFWKAVNLINQSGLNKKYVSGVTDFDAYIASNPLHSATDLNTEWSTPNNPRTSARFTVDFGTEVTIGSLALWDDESSSLDQLVLSAPGLGTVASFMNVDGPAGVPYGAQVFGFRPITTRYLTFDLSGCGQEGYSNRGCSIGEIAFEAATLTSAVPEPATWAMMITGFGAVGSMVRRSRRRLAFA